MSTPNQKHLVDLNRLVRYLHKLVATSRHRLVFGRFEPPVIIVAVGDSASSAGEFEALVLRGDFLMPMSRLTGKLGGNANALDYYCRTQHRRVRSTFTAELYNLIDITNLALIISSLFTEATSGAMSAERLCDAAEESRFAFLVESVVDARSVYDALASSPVKPREEETMPVHLLKILEWLVLCGFRALWWCDTEDMVADALTKGSVD